MGPMKGAALKPYGDNAEVVEECTGCHAPMGRNDFVYTMPISGHAGRADRLNGKAALMPKLPFEPFTAIPITMYVDRTQATISVLFRKSTRGKELLLITWTSRMTRTGSARGSREILFGRSMFMQIRVRHLPHISASQKTDRPIARLIHSLRGTGRSSSNS